ncbi:fumarylacetoacetate hydrolase family protein [Geodermatophilus ruber]|uniref:2-keto-4-pentenoate hydratase/2-oxohepta-3-ene-1,7-dioic acid hydratase (Catechol pathway) n=1 Tax=Geodermatophilus ruber TaxID=504800 RepID=A0A1I4I4W9_9ACTN|nr:fumarylacetoacetate hydrolase family protein [Geodermatophilus ruber]SFL49349.1 2-keto-4-pentenoate hydratase/2-oxohepta-3-ene-1,7-dioic acid hydratase (catechol pathway) [Geodermatophilus ruber]
MRWSSYLSPTDGREHPAVVSGGALHGLRTATRLIDLLGDDGERLARAGEEALADPLDVVPEGEARLLAPIPAPPSVRDFYAFETHVRTYREANGQQMDPGWYELPVFYFQNPAAIRSAREEIPMSPGSVQFDFELELAAVIGCGGADLRPEEAERHIAGYTLFCDWSARDLQAREMRQGLGPVKGKDTATSLGPWLITPDELEPHRAGVSFDLEMRAAVNGRPCSKGNAADLYWSFGQMVAYASRGTRVQTGDVIGSGTVGTGCILELAAVHGEQAYPWLTPGDEVRLEVDLLGAITARITEAGPLHPLT